jgi:hypothetical protein
MKITILIEGKTEMAFKPHLRAFLEPRAAGRMPRLDMFLYDGRIPKEDNLRCKSRGFIEDWAIPCGCGYCPD